MFTAEVAEAWLKWEMHGGIKEQRQDCDGDVQRVGAKADVEHGELQR